MSTPPSGAEARLSLCFALGADGSLQAATVPPTPRSGVYTAFRTYGQSLFLALDRHLARLAESAARAGIVQSTPEAAIRRGLAAAIAEWPGADARVRIELHPEGPPCTLLLSPFTPLPEEAFTRGLRVRTAPPGAARPDPRTKQLAWMEDRLRWQRDPGADEHLLLNPEGAVLEGFTSNFWGLRDGVVQTAGAGILLGITRGLLLEILAELALPIALVAPDPTGLQEAAISSSTRGIVPVVEIDGLPVGDGLPGPTFTALLYAWRARVARDLRPAVEK